MNSPSSPVRHPDRLFIDGGWVEPSSTSSFEVVDSNTEELYFRVAAASAPDVGRAVGAARTAFDVGPWPRLTHADRAEFLRRFSEELRRRSDVLADIWPRESGALRTIAVPRSDADPRILDFYADLAADYPWEEVVTPTNPGFGLLVREPVGVVGAIVPWNGPLSLALWKIAPALLTGCTVVLKASPEAPGAAYVIAESAEAAGLPPGVLNVLTADREVSEALVRDPRVDKIAFTGSTSAGRRIASILGERIGRCTLELGGKSAAVVLDDADLGEVAHRVATAECLLAGQVCSSLTRVIVTRHRHDALVEAIASTFSEVVVGNAFDDATQMGPLVSAQQRDRVESYIASGTSEGARLATGGGRPGHLDRGYFVEPTVFADVDNGSRVAQEEIFGPVLCVIPVPDEASAVEVANDTIYGLNSAVFTPDADRARHIAGRLRSGTVGHNGYRTDFGIAFGGFKQSGLGREGGREGLLAYLETKTVLLDGPPRLYR